MFLYLFHLFFCLSTVAGVNPVTATDGFSSNADQHLKKHKCFAYCLELQLQYVNTTPLKQTETACFFESMKV